MASKELLGLLILHLVVVCGGVGKPDYGNALSKSLLFYEAQRSGQLPSGQRVTWRGDSGLRDGSDAGINLVGGYYDAGDNVKFGFPMAFTVTMLSWGAIEYSDKLDAKNELFHALEAIKWGTDYLIEAHPSPGVLYGEVGDGISDHQCWQRPEDMTTSRGTFKIDNQHPGADLAGETAAAFAAAAIAFKKISPSYSSELINHATQLFDFARNHPGRYQNSIPQAAAFYPSSGFEDEVSWAAAWLHWATGDKKYLDFLESSRNTVGTRSMFSWDDKYVGVQVKIAKLVLEGKVGNTGTIWAQYKSQAEQFICSLLQKGNSNVQKTPGGLLWWQPWNNLQYTTAATFIAAVYSDHLAAQGASIQCPSGSATPSDLDQLVQSQVDYILGSNPKGMSYLVGFGPNYPTQVHHRGASNVSIKKDPTPDSCNGGFGLWYNRNGPNPNVIDGVIVGGPGASDEYSDSRSNYMQSEPSTVNSAPLVGVLARLA